MKKDELTKEFDGYMKDHPEIDYLSFNGCNFGLN